MRKAASRGKIFTTVQVPKPQTSTFDLSHDHKLTCNMGLLIPTLVQECIPGDNFNISNQSLTRLAPLQSPAYTRIKSYMHYFFVPNRIVWENFGQWIYGEKKPNADVYVPPTIEVQSGHEVHIPVGSLWDYMGLPTGKRFDKDDGNDVNFIPFGAYQRIWYEWYRDQNAIAPESNVKQLDLPDGVTSLGSSFGLQMTTLQKRAWRPDYFTSAQKEPQKGEDVMFPLGQFEDVALGAYRDANPLDEISMVMKRTSTGTPVGANYSMEVEEETGIVHQFPVEDGTELYNTYQDGYAKTSDLTGTLAPTINDLRRAYAVQRWLEINARGGTRYVEGNKAHFNVVSSDARLNNPEYIGGSVTSIVISEVLQTSQTNTDEENPSALGDMAGHAISAGSQPNINYYCEEHGFIIGILSYLPEAGYFQGIPRHFCARKDRFDYPWPSLAHLGEQAILNKELYYDGAEAQKEEDNDTFGYIPRYAEYRYNHNRISGEFRTSLDFWHYYQIYTSRPALNQTFIEFAEDFRIFAVETPTVHHILVHMYHQIYANRRLPMYGTPI